MGLSFHKWLDFLTYNSSTPDVFVASSTWFSCGFPMVFLWKKKKKKKKNKTLGGFPGRLDRKDRTPATPGISMEIVQLKVQGQLAFL